MGDNTMKDAKCIMERRKFIKRAISVGAAIWLTPTILSVKSNNAHAQLSGGGLPPGGRGGGLPPVGGGGGLPPGGGGGGRGRGRH